MRKVNRKEMSRNIPDDIKVLFGKYFVFSIILILLLGIAYPFLVLEYFSIFSKIGVLVLLLLFYIYMLYNLFKKKQKFMSLFVPFSIFIIIMLFIFDIVKLVSSLIN